MLHDLEEDRGWKKGRGFLLSSWVTWTFLLLVVPSNGVLPAEGSASETLDVVRAIAAEQTSPPIAEGRPELPQKEGLQEGSDQQLRVAQDDTATPAKLAPSMMRSGLYGWGVGLEFPIVGIMSGAAGVSQLGVGYTLGGAISWELTPKIMSRLRLSGGATSGGRAFVSFLRQGQRFFAEQDAEWLNIEVTLGGAYLFRDPLRPWTPYLGVDVGLNFSGYEYLLDEALREDLADPNDLTRRFDDGGHFGLELGWTVVLRGGIQLELVRWLASMLELSVAYTRIANDRISNTLDAPDVRTVSENIWVIRTNFITRFGL